MMRIKSIFPQCAAVFCILLCAFLLVFSGFSSTDDEQLFSALTANLAQGRGYSAPTLFGNDRLQGGSSGVEPLHPILGIPLYLTAEKFGLGKVQILYLLPGVYTALTAALLVAISYKKGYSKKTSILLGVAYGFGTIAFPYARTNFREPLAALLITATTLCIEKNDEMDQKTWKNTIYAAIGLIFLILAVLTKIITAILIPFLAISFITKIHKFKKDNRSKQFIGLLTAAVLFLLIIAILQFFFPADSLSRFTIHFFDYIRYTLPRIPHDHFWPALAGLLLSPGKGLLIYSPMLILSVISPFQKQKKMTADWYIYVAALLAFAVGQALIYDDQWWSITWGTRALIPVLPLVCLATLPGLDAGLNNQKKHIRILTVSLLAVSGMVQIGRLLTSDPVYSNWLVQFTGRGIHASMQWDIRVMPLIRHWWLAFNNQTSDIAWFYLYKKATGIFLILVFFALISTLISMYLIANKCSKRTGLFLILTGLILGMLVLTPITAQFDQRYNKEVTVFREITSQVCADTNRDDLVLLDAYLKPFWWYYSNFGCVKSDWVGLPYLHQTAINSELYFPRISTVLELTQNTISNGKQVFLIQSPRETTWSYADEMEKAGFLVELTRAYSNPDMQIFKLEKQK